MEFGWDYEIYKVSQGMYIYEWRKNVFDHMVSKEWKGKYTDCTILSKQTQDINP